MAQEIRDTYSVQTRVIIFDFSKLATLESAEGLKALLDKELKDIDVSMLVNNVGCAFFGDLKSHTIWDSMRQINVNVNSQTYMSMFMLPRLLARGETGRSAIINVSSVAAYFSGGSLPVYCATKAYNWHLSESMREAYNDQIDVLTVTPNSVKTQMNSGRYCFTVTAESHARQTINQLGWAKVTYGAATHAAQPYIKSIFPIGYIVDKVNAMRRAQWQREEALKKQQKEADPEIS